LDDVGPPLAPHLSLGSVLICTPPPQICSLFPPRHSESSAIFPGTALVTRFGVANSNPSFTLAAVRQSDRPLQDEWGLFDPRQAGLEALLRKIRMRAKDVEATDDTSPTAEKKIVCYVDECVHAQFYCRSR